MLTRLWANFVVTVLTLAAPQTLWAYLGNVEATIAWGFGGEDHLWSGVLPGNSLPTVANDTYFSELGGYNDRAYYNPDFADTGACASLVPADAQSISIRKYGCQYVSMSGDPAFIAAPVTDAGPAVLAHGSLFVTDTTLTGTLQVIASTDEPTGATTTVNAGVRLSNSTGNGFTGYNYRAYEQSPFGNVWYGVTTNATLQLNLTGSFTSTNWNITGGWVDFSDSGFACQQGGFGGDARGTLCTPSGTGGGFANDGGNLSWGMDADGGLTTASNNPTPGQIQVRDSTNSVISSLSGVLAHTVLSESAAYDPVNGWAGYQTVGLVGETRRGVGSAQGCLSSLRWDGTAITCGTLVVSKFAGCFSLYTADPLPPSMPACDPVALVAPVPLPASGALLLSTIGVLVTLRRKAG